MRTGLKILIRIHSSISQERKLLRLPVSPLFPHLAPIPPMTPQQQGQAEGAHSHRGVQDPQAVRSRMRKQAYPPNPLSGAPPPRYTSHLTISQTRRARIATRHPSTLIIHGRLTCPRMRESWLLRAVLRRRWRPHVDDLQFSPNRERRSAGHHRSEQRRRTRAESGQTAPGSNGFPPATRLFEEVGRYSRCGTWGGHLFGPAL
jgi:hypothetical protein